MVFFHSHMCYTFLVHECSRLQSHLVNSPIAHGALPFTCCCYSAIAASNNSHPMSTNYKQYLIRLLIIITFRTICTASYIFKRIHFVTNRLQNSKQYLCVTTIATVTMHSDTPCNIQERLAPEYTCYSLAQK